MESVQNTFTELPVVDVSGLMSNDLEKRKSAASALGKAAREVGFFYVKGHGISRDLRAKLLHQTKAFFDLPEEKKMEVFIGKSNNHRGYVPEGEEVMLGGKRDRKEALDLGLEVPIDHPLVKQKTPMVGPNQWPELPGFKQDIGAYYETVFKLGQTLLRGFALAMGQEETFFDKYVTCPPSQLRLLHYPFDPDAEDAQGIGAHTDYECFTMLLPTAPGLEVMNGNGDWIDVPLIEDAYIVNIGDMMEVWTNGQFVATSHRVRKVKEERYSFPLFFAADYHTTVAPLPELLEGDQKPKYDALSSGEHLFSQTIQSFCYLRDRVDSGKVEVPKGAKALSSFGQEARQSKSQDV